MKKYQPFRFKAFEIGHDRCAMKVGTDGVLLGAWTNIQHCRRALDIGTGTGLIALMLAQRQPHALIEALEIEPLAAQQAQENFLASPWADRLHLAGSALQDFAPSGFYDLIISNPPFFVDAYVSGQQARDQARHTHSLPHALLIEKAAQWLSPQGRLALVLPVAEARQAMGLALQQGLHLRRRLQMRHSPHAQPKRWLMEFSAQAGALQEEEIAIREADGHTFSAAYRALTRDFHPMF